MKNTEFVEKLINIAKNYKTLYVMGCIGAPLTQNNVAYYCTNHTYNQNATRTKMIKAAADQSPVVYGFDCVCLIKSVLWGWCGDSAKSYGGAKYANNDVPDIGANQMILKCSDVSTVNWNDMVIGEAVWTTNHIGVYIGDGLVVECSPKWDNGVQITAVKNIGTKSGYNSRTWKKHGKLPWVDYVASSNASTAQQIKKSSVSLPILKKGASGESVMALQALLNLRDNAELIIDGSFGSATDNAFRSWQKKTGLTQDGSVGPKSWSKLIGG